MDELLVKKDKVTDEHKLVDELLLIKDKITDEHKLVDELLLIKDKVTEEHKLVDEWAKRQICKLFSNISKTTHTLLDSKRCLIGL